MNANPSLRSTLLTAAAAVLCSGLQFAGIDAIAAPRIAIATVQLPTVLITAQRDTAMVVQQLPRVVIVGQRNGRLPAVTAQFKTVRAI